MVVVVVEWRGEEEVFRARTLKRARFSVTAKPLHYTFILGPRNPVTPSPTKRPQTTRAEGLIGFIPSKETQGQANVLYKPIHRFFLSLRAEPRLTPPIRSEVPKGLIKLTLLPGLVCRFNAERNRFLVSCTSASRVSSLPPTTDLLPPRSYSSPPSRCLPPPSLPPGVAAAVRFPPHTPSASNSPWYLQNMPRTLSCRVGWCCGFQNKGML